MKFAELQNWHGKFGNLAWNALSSTHYERGPFDIAKQLTSTPIGMPEPVLS
jgi:hypothetical protein